MPSNVGFVAWEHHMQGPKPHKQMNLDSKCYYLNSSVVTGSFKCAWKSNDFLYSNGPLLPRNYSLGQSEPSGVVTGELPCNDSGNSSSCSVQTPTSSISSLSLISPLTSSAPNSAASSIGGSIVKVCLHYYRITTACSPKYSESRVMILPERMIPF